MNPMKSGGMAAAITVILLAELSRAGITIAPDEAGAIGTVLWGVIHFISGFMPKPKTAQTSGEAS